MPARDALAAACARTRCGHGVHRLAVQAWAMAVAGPVGVVFRRYRSAGPSF